MGDSQIRAYSRKTMKYIEGSLEFRIRLKYFQLSVASIQVPFIKKKKIIIISIVIQQLTAIALQVVAL